MTSEGPKRRRLPAKVVSVTIHFWQDGRVKQVSAPNMAEVHNALRELGVIKVRKHRKTGENSR
jgi:hypothetical protein